MVNNACWAVKERGLSLNRRKRLIVEPLRNARAVSDQVA
jgi:hypothetical protein